MKMMNKLFFLALFWSLTTYAQLGVNVSPPNAVGSKTLVKLEMVNGFSEPVESARAVCFLLDGQGKMAGQSTQWVIGGQAGPAPSLGLAAGATNVFHFVIAAERTASTNLQARVSFSRVSLEGGKLVDANAAVKIEQAAK